MFKPVERFISVKLDYRDVTAEQATIVKRLLQNNGSRDNVLVVMGFADYNERTGRLAVAADLQPGVTEHDLETAIERRVVAGNLSRT